MKRLVRSKSGRHIYGQKWQDFGGINDECAFIESTETAQDSVVHNENQTRKGNRRGVSDHQSAMYKAALEGDWLAAEILLEHDPTLACDEITEWGDRALHVVVSMKHENFLQKLVQRMNRSDLELLDGPRGCTACCYAAISGTVEIVDVLMKKNPSLGTVRDVNGVTPLHKAALHGNEDVVWYFLKSVKIEDLFKEEWFDLLLVTIRNKMYDMSLEILEMDGSLATMRSPDGTALHLLARLDISSDFFASREGRGWILHPFIFFPVKTIKVDGDMELNLLLLAEKLWSEIQKLDEATVLDLMKNPLILHDAAKVGNAELITMLTRTCPNLTWDIDSDGYTIFHIAVMYRRENIFNLIHQIGAMKYFIAISQDEKGDNILHLAAKKALPDARKIVPESAIQMQRDIRWFKEVEAVVPPPCLETRNKDGLTPVDLFSAQHKELLEKSETWMRNTSNSCMIATTIVLNVVFAAAFTPPGGNNAETGIPIHLKSRWFTCFVLIEAMAFSSSTLCIIVLQSIMTSSFEENEFGQTLPNLLKFRLIGLVTSLHQALLVFMFTYLVVFVKQRPALVICFIISVCSMLLFAVGYQFNKLWLNVNIPAYLSGKLARPSRYSLFKRDDAITKKKSWLSNAFRI